MTEKPNAHILFPEGSIPMSNEQLMQEIEALKCELERQKAVNEIQQVMAHYEAVHLNPAYIARSIECFADWRDDISADVSDWGCFFGYDAPSRASGRARPGTTFGAASSSTPSAPPAFRLPETAKLPRPPG